MTVNSGCTLNIGSNLTCVLSADAGVNGTLSVSGKLNCGSAVISGGGTTQINSGATFETAHSQGIRLTGESAGAIETTTRTLSTSANYIFDPNCAETGDGLPTTVNNLTCNGSGEIVLKTDTAVNGALSVTGGTFRLGGHTLTLNGTASVSSGAIFQVDDAAGGGAGGTLYANSTQITGAGTFNLYGTLEMKDANGIASSGASGQVQTTTRSFFTGSSYIYDGSSAQVTGSGVPSTISALSVSNPSGVTQSGASLIASGLVTLSGNGIYNLNGNSLTANGAVTVGSGCTLNDHSTLVINNSLVVNGILDCDANAVTGTGTFTLNSGGTLKMQHTGGVNGQIAVSGTKTFSTGANYTYDGSSAQVTGTSLPATINNLVVSNSAGVTLNIASLTANGTATLSSNGVFNLNNQSFTGNGGITIGSGCTLNDHSTLVDNSSLVINGTLDCDANAVTGTGSLTLNSGGTLKMEHTGGVDGQITVSGAKSYSTGANYTFDGSGSQVTGASMPTTVNNLTVNSATLSGDVAVGGALSVAVSGSLNTGAHILTLNGSCSVGGLATLTVDSGGRLNTNSVIFSAGSGSNFVLSSGGTLETKYVNGVSGNQIQTANNSFSSSANYILDGTSAQQTSELPSGVNNLTCSNTAGVSLTNDTTVNGALSVPSGTFSTSNRTLNLNGTATVAGTLDVPDQGTIIANANQITGAGTTTLENGSTFKTTNAIGVSATPTFGAIQTTTKNLGSGANFVFNGSAFQVTGDAFPSKVRSLAIDNPTTVSLTNSTTATEQLTLTQGVLDATGKTLVVDSDLPSDSVQRGTGWIKGSITRFYDRSVNDVLKDFPVGTTGFAGVQLDNGVGSGTGYVTVSTADGDPPNVVAGSGVLNRYWTLTATGFDPSGLEVQFNYLDSDVTGTVNESTMVLARYTGGGWQEITPGFRDTAGNVITTFSAPGFSIWTAGNPSDVPVRISDFHLD